MSRRSSQGAARPTSQSSPLPSAEASRGTRRPREDTDPDEGNTGTKRRPWTQAEDEQVIRIVSITDGKRWAEADLLPPGRTAKQCRERYHNHLDPRMNRKEPWSEQEDRILLGGRPRASPTRRQRRQRGWTCCAYARCVTAEAEGARHCV